MTNSVEFSETVRSFMDLFVGRSMHGWKRFARESGMSMPQFSILMQLHYKGSCSVSDISGHFETTNAAASQLIDRLFQAGFLERAEDPNDRRSRLLTLSPRGRDLMEESIRERYRWVDELAGILSPEDQAKVLEGMALMTRAARELEPAA